MTLEFFKIIAALFILLVAIAGGIWPFFRKRIKIVESGKLVTFDFPTGESLATGIFLGAGLIHMLPDAASAFAKAGYHYPFAFLIAAISFLLLLLIEHISVSLEHKSSSSLVTNIALLTTIILTIHSLFEGTAVGISENLLDTIVIVIAIIAHKGAAGFALAMQLNRNNLSLLFRVLCFSVFVIMTPLGIFLGDQISLLTTDISLLPPIFNALAAGTFIYIGTLHGLERASLIRYCCNMKEFLMMITGFSLMAVIAIWN